MSIYFKKFHETFFSSDGLILTIELLNVQHEGTLVNTISLLYSLIESENLSKQVLDLGKQEIIELLQNVLVTGIDILGVSYGPKVGYYALLAVNALLNQHSEIAKNISSRTIEYLCNLVQPKCLSKIPVHYEIEIYRFFEHIVQQDKQVQE